MEETVKTEKNVEKQEKIKKKFIKFLKEPLLYLMIIIIFIQIIIYANVPKWSSTTDSDSYLDSYNEGSILNGYVNNQRTPVYPYFIKVIKKLGGEENFRENITKVQKVLFIVTVVLFYYTLKMLIKNKIIVSVLTLIFGISPTIIVWNSFILTESLSILEMTFLSFITIKYLKKPSKITAGLMGFVIIAMILTRPAFIYILPIYILFIILRWFLQKEERKKLIFAIGSLLICCIILTLYCLQIKRYYGTFGLTSVSGLNNLVVSIYSDAYKDGNNAELIKEIDDMKKDDNSTQICFYIYNMLSKTHSQEELANFASESLKNNPKFKDFLVKKTTELAPVNIATSYAIVQDSDGKIICNYRDIGSILLPITFGMIYILLIISIIYLIWYLIKYKKINWICAFFTSTIFANIFTLVVGAPFEEQRLFFPSMCLVILYVGVIIDKIKLKEENLLNEKNV